SVNIQIGKASPHTENKKPIRTSDALGSPRLRRRRSPNLPRKKLKLKKRPRPIAQIMKMKIPLTTGKRTSWGRFSKRFLMRFSGKAKIIQTAKKRATGIVASAKKRPRPLSCPRSGSTRSFPHSGQLPIIGGVVLPQCGQDVLITEPTKDLFRPKRE